MQIHRYIAYDFKEAKMTILSGNAMDLIPSSWTAVFPFISGIPGSSVSKQNDCEMRILGCDSSGSGSIVDDDFL